MESIKSRLNFDEVTLFDLFFHDIASNDDGASIYIDNPKISFIIESSIFNQCRIEFSLEKTSGCIFFVTKTGEFECFKVCANECSSYHCSFLCSSLDVETKNKNCIKLSSYSHCPSDFSFSYESICRFIGGISFADELNSSSNKIQDIVDFGIEQSFDTFVKHSNFFNVTASALFCLWDIKTESKLEYSSFIQCNRLATTYDLIHYSTFDISLTVQYCIFLSNDITLFEVNRNGMIYILNCYIDEYSYNLNKSPPSTLNLFTPPEEYLNKDWFQKSSCHLNLLTVLKNQQSFKHKIPNSMLFILLYPNK